MKFSPVKIELKPGDKDGDRRRDHMGIQVVGRERRGEGPARIDAAQHQRGQHQRAADDIQIPAQQVDLGEGQVARAQHNRDQEVAQRRRHRRHQEQEDHDDAVHGEELVVGVRRHQVRLRRQQFQPDQPRKRAADKEEERNRDQVQHRDALVVAGQQPAQQAMLRGDVVPLRHRRGALVGQIENRCTRCAHGFTTPDAGGAAWSECDVVSVCCTR